MSALLFIAAQLLGPLLLVILIPLGLYWFFSGSAQKHSETPSGTDHERNDMLLGLGLGCLIPVVVMGVMGFLAYKLYDMIPG